MIDYTISYHVEHNNWGGEMEKGKQVKNNKHWNNKGYNKVAVLIKFSVGT